MLTLAAGSNNNRGKTMKLHILGCGDAFGSGGRLQSSYLVEANDRLFLLDCGATALLAMKRAGFDPRRLDAIMISHLHGDHFGGLPFFLIDYLYRQPKNDPLLIAGPPGTEAKVRQLFNLMYGAAGGDKALPPTVFQVLHPNQPACVAGADIFSFRVPHQSEAISLALKVSYEGKQILFSGDSLWTESFIDQARGVDLFLCECSFYREQPGMHVNYQALEANLARLQCRRLILTHLGEEMLAHRHELAVQVAADGMVIEV
jgi:ribonuclease BN (tRNA processing enzyme)